MPRLPNIQSYTPFMNALERKLKETRAERTVLDYMDSLLRLRPRWTHPKCGFTCAKPMRSLEFLRDYSRIVGIIESYDNKHSMWNFYKAILVVLGTDDSYADAYAWYRTKSAPLKCRIDECYASGEKTDKEKKCMIPWADVIAKRDSLTPNTLEHLYLCLYTMIPPVRNDYVDMVVSRSKTPDQCTDPTKNYYLEEYGCFVWNASKNEVGIVNRVQHLPSDLVDVLNDYIIANHPSVPGIVSAPDRPLFVGARGGFVTGSFIASKLRKIFGHCMSANILRKIYLSHHYGNARNLVEDTKSMHTSVTAATTFYIKKD